MFYFSQKYLHVNMCFPAALRLKMINNDLKKKKQSSQGTNNEGGREVSEVRKEVSRNSP